MIFFDSQSYTLPVVASVIVHGIILFFVVNGWQEHTERRTPQQISYIPAKLIQLEKTAPKANPKQKPRTIDRAAQQREQERLKREAERKRQVDLAKKQQADKAKKEKARIEKENAVAEVERKRREREIQDQLIREQEINDALAQEDALLQSEEDEALANSYKGSIYDRVFRNWNYPPSTRKGMRCRVSVALVPTGRVVDVKLVESSGNSAFDRSAEQAVWKTEQFPELKEVPATIFEKHFRSIIIIFEPQDTRL